MRLYTLFIFMLFIIACGTTQKIVNESVVKSSYDGKDISTSTKIAIYFTSGFKDSLLIRQNNIDIYKGFFKSDWSTSFTGIIETLDYKHGQEVEIVELYTGKVIIVKLIKGYKIIELSKSSNEWSAIYTNRPPIFD